MKVNTISRALTGIIVMAFSSVCLANTILDTTTSILQNDPIQWGRISRNQIQQDWVGTEAFGGAIYTDWQFHHHTYTIPSAVLAQGRFVQIHLDDLGLQQGNLFVSAYTNSFDPTSLGTNWLGDAGTSGNLAGTNPVFFQVLVPPATDLIIVVWNTDYISGLGIGERFRLLAEQFTDVAYSEPVSQPALPTINLQASKLQIKKGNKAVLTFTASSAPAQATTVNYSTSGSAQLAVDYSLTGTPGHVVFSAGQTSATVTLKASERTLNKDNRTATITVQSGASYLIGPNNSASVTIKGN